MREGMVKGGSRIFVGTAGVLPLATSVWRAVSVWSWVLAGG